jgi:hypothetical protein
MQFHTKSVPLYENNVSRQNTISIVTWLQVVEPTDLGLTSNKDTIFSLAPDIPIQHTAQTAYRSIRSMNKGPGFETDKRFLFPRFIKGGIYIY